ncbi:MAG: acyltransferase 3 [Actinomycetia bacterium]|nr:acyltransferase 3 [Actinomycetes bacterium]
MPTLAPPAARYLPALDGLRAFAVLAVVAFHTDHGLRGGYLGVEVFFVLSGYLITNLLLTESVRMGHVRLGHFYLRRAARLLPALVLAVLGVAALYTIESRVRPPLGEAVTGFAAVFLFAANWVEAHDSGSMYFLGHTWSLAVEEQFYLVWPPVLVVLLRWRRTLRSVLVMTLVGAVASMVLRALLAFGGEGARLQAGYGSPARAGALLLGCGLAVALHVPEVAARLRRPATAWAGLGGAVVIAVAVFVAPSDQRATFTVWLPLVALASTALVAHCTTGTSRLTEALSLRPLVWIGRRSYGIYLFHFPILAYTHGNVAEDVGWAALAIAAAGLSYRFVESPTLRLANDRRTAVDSAPTELEHVEALDLTPAPPSTGG